MSNRSHTFYERILIFGKHLPMSILRLKVCTVLRRTIIIASHIIVRAIPKFSTRYICNLNIYIYVLKCVFLYRVDMVHISDVSQENRWYDQPCMCPPGSDRVFCVQP